MTKKIAEGKALGLKYEIYDNTGIIEQIEFNRDMLITPSSRRYMVNLPTFDGGAPQAKYHQQILLQGDNSAINVDGSLVADHSGEQLTLFLLTQSRNKQGRYFGSVNHSTQKTTDNPISLRDQLFPWTSFWAACALTLVLAVIYQLTQLDRGVGQALFVTAFSSPGIFLPLYAVCWVIALIRAIVVRQNRDFKIYYQNLRQHLGNNQPELA